MNGPDRLPLWALLVLAAAWATYGVLCILLVMWISWLFSIAVLVAVAMLVVVLWALVMRGRRRLGGN